MTTGIESNRCLVCEKAAAKCNCTGCKAYFCVKHFNEHRQQLSLKFDDVVTRTHDELLNQIDKTNQPNIPSADLLSQIDQWETATIEKVHKTAESARHQLTELFNRDRETLINQFEILTKEISSRREEDDFAEDDIERLRTMINQMQISLEQITRSDKTKLILVENDEIDWNHLINVEKEETISPLWVIDIKANATWIQSGLTVAGGNGEGNAINQLGRPSGFYIDHDQTVYIADFDNHRIMKWKSGAANGQVVAGGNAEGYRADQLYSPTDVIIDNERDSFIICDYNNLRVVRWPRRNGTSGETIISDIRCVGLTMADNGSLYVTDYKKHEVRRYRVGESNGTVVAGGNGSGNRLDQLQCPRWIFVDQDHSLYVSDNENHRVMKWVKDAKEGVIVAGGQGRGNRLTQLSYPCGVVVDQLETVYVADSWNNRIMCWPKGATEGITMVGGNGRGGQPNQLNQPTGLSFDRQGNLYVTDQCNHRVQKFNIAPNL